MHHNGQHHPRENNIPPALLAKYGVFLLHNNFSSSSDITTRPSIKKGLALLNKTSQDALPPSQISSVELYH
ncbi:uncharacterized protein PHALS_02125 [Plasmopara halstedii]|uniref:Uncharacterized protein n=1 Tax=Plasmopara halstedii TaxID=4781 RepID=A0A0P1AW99_PLAHL|nr:uncharacterized protein PHALS_02125 [Plasmopara halstedii]CEG45852.1 hypothetical protein PHALS_02125 [Plasmopara halstedii]|eukprot:XP_024582221.1 hypothetical protein PHALS_02125 [Plasmopara halstedii]